MRYLLILIFLLFLNPSAPAYDIPKILRTIGFAKYHLIRYERKGKLEYFVFTDWRTENRDDIVTFVVKDGQIIEQTTGVGEYNQQAFEKEKEKP